MPNILLAARHAEAQSSLALRSERYAAGLGGYAAFLDASRNPDASGGGGGHMVC